VRVALFLVCKWQAGEDAHGDGFQREHENGVIKAASKEELQQVISKVTVTEVYANEYLYLEIASLYASDTSGMLYQSMESFLAGFPTALAKLKE
jgi:hypothetical protein